MHDNGSSPVTSTSRRFLKCCLLLLLSEGLWWAFAFLVVPTIITHAYYGRSLAAINHFFVEGARPVEFYLEQWRIMTWQGIVFWIVLWSFLWLYTSANFARRFVGQATPEDIAALRILTCSILLISTLWEDVPSTAALPRGLVRPMGILELLYALPLGFSQFVTSPSALTIFRCSTALLLTSGALGWWTRLTLPLAAIGYLLLGGIMRQYAWFYHTGLVPLYVLLFLAWTPCGDGWSLDRWWKQRRGASVPQAWQPTLTYGWIRYGCWMMIALPYVAAGLSKFRNGGWFWWEATNFRQILYRSTLSPMQFSFDLALDLVHAPDAFVALLALAGVLGEVFYGLVLFFRRARFVLPLLMATMHIGILLLQNILFFDLILLQLAFVPVTALRCWWLRRYRPGISADTPVAASQRFATSPMFYRRLLLSIMVVCMFCWLCRIEFYPFTGMQMFSAYDTSGAIVYDKVLAHAASGAVTRAPIEQCFGGMADGRYRRVLAMVWEEKTRTIGQEFFQTCGNRWNQQARSSERIVQFEVQRWLWRFKAEPTHPTHGEMVGQRLFAVP